MRCTTGCVIVVSLLAFALSACRPNFIAFSAATTTCDMEMVRQEVKAACAEALNVQRQ